MKIKLVQNRGNLIARMWNFCCLTATLIATLKVLIFLATCTIVCISFILPALIIYWRRVFARRRLQKIRNEIVIGFFHPYCNSGGGGERVLWEAIVALQKKYSNVQIVVYTGDLDADPEQILRRVKSTFNINIESTIKFVYLHRRKWVEADIYPYFTLLGQCLGSIWLGIEALNSLQPDIYIDTMGYAFTYPLFRYVGGCRVGTYTHYPTISTDMLKHVYKRIASHNNHRIIARNPFLSAAKIVYYKIFALLYGWTGRCAETVMVNSSWTEEHINSIWNCPLKTHRIYPPCDIENLMKLPLLEDDQKGEFIKIVSIAQFRPEKGHPLMLRAMYELRTLLEEEIWERIRLVLIGSCRNADDEARVKDMQDLAKHLALDENVEFKLNIPYPELLDELQVGSIGLHAMWNEHFGISIVESMAAGLIMVAHASGGPRADIIETQSSSQTGFLADDVEEYGRVLAHVISMHPKDRNVIRHAARASVSRFSCEQFQKEFLRTIAPFFLPKQE